jgi:hypothetical protein
MDLNGEVVKFLRIIMLNCNDIKLEMRIIPHILLSRMLGWSRYQENLIITFRPH